MTTGIDRSIRRLAVGTPALAILALLCAAGCATAPASYRDPVPDPIERVNRGIYAFNRGLDKVTLKPLARGYDKLPKPIRTGVGNFFNNLQEPRTIINDLLQGKFAQAGRDTARFVLNSTLGLGGLLDPAKGAGLERHIEGFAQTLAVWGVGSGPYLMLPVLGPATLRDGFARIVDVYTFPLLYYEVSSVRDKLLVLEAIDLRARFLDAERALEDALDPYVFLRESYVQRLTYEIYDGNPPEPDFEEEDWEDEEFEVAPPPGDG